MKNKDFAPLAPLDLKGDHALNERQSKVLSLTEREDKKSSFYALNLQLPAVYNAYKRLPVYLEGLGKESLEGGVERPYGFWYHQILVVLEGTFFYTDPNGDRLLQKGDCLLIPKGAPHSYSGVTDDHFMLWLSFSGPYAEELLRALNFKETVIVSSPRYTSLVTKHTAMMDAIAIRFKPTQQSAFAYDYILEFYDIYQEAKGGKESKTWVEQIRDYIDKQYMTPLNLTRLAQQVSVSKFQLTRAFKALYGVTVFDYITSVRLKNAKILLKSDRSLTIKETAYLVGYNDNVYFGKIFRKNEGVTPSEYKRRYWQNVSDSKTSAKSEPSPGISPLSPPNATNKTP